jgi:hypothetical protein
MLALVLLSLAGLVLVALVVATVRLVARDGYGRAPYRAHHDSRLPMR